MNKVDNLPETREINQTDNYDSHHANVPRFELDKVRDLSGCDINFDAVLRFNQGIRVSER